MTGIWYNYDWIYIYIYIYNYDWYTLLYYRNQHKIVKQLSIN